MSGKSLRVATWNILHGMDLRRGGRVDLGVVAHAISQFEADIVALQEVDRSQPRSGGEDQIAVLTQRLGWAGSFSPALFGSPDSLWTVTQRDPAGAASEGAPAYGVGLLSRHPLSRIRWLRLPGGGDGQRRKAPASPSPGWDHEPRVALGATVDMHGVAVEVTTTHLSYLPWRGLRQLRVAARAAAIASAQAPAVLLGDFNLPPWAARAAARGWTHAGGEPSYPAADPRMQVDQIFVRGLDIAAVRLGDPAGSDHRPVIADLLLP